jgi:sec-independent protein translocase protein TatA
VPGHWELIALAVVILLVFGSKQLPSLARNLGRGVREVRETVIDVDPRASLRELEAPREQEPPAAQAPGEPTNPGQRQNPGGGPPA